MRTRSKWGKRVLAIAVSTAAAASMGEIAFRIVYGTPIDERLPLMEVRANAARGFEMIPNTEHYTYLEHVRVNNLGLRGADVGPKLANEMRVVALGDSLVYGQGVAEEDTLPVRMEHAIDAMERSLSAAASEHASTRACRVVNAGVRSYATEQELALLTELLPAVQPDVVVLFWFANDIEDQRIHATYERLTHTGPVVFDVGARMEGRTRLDWELTQLARKSALMMRLHDLWSEAHYPHLADDARDKAYADLDRRLEEVSRSLAAAGIDFLLVVIPVARELALEGSAASTLRVQAIARARAIAFLDGAPALKEIVRANGALPVLPYDGHYTGIANEAIADAVATALAAHFPARFTITK